MSWKRVLVAAMCAVTLAGCSSNVELGVDGGDEPASANACSGDCSQEGVYILDSPCAAGFETVAGEQDASAVGLGGSATVSIRRSKVNDNPACQLLYWGRLSLKAENTVPYVLVLTITDDEGGKRSQPAKSVYPGAEQVTPTIKASEGQQLELCVNSQPAKPEPVCISADAP